MRALVVGLERSGLAALELLKKRGVHWRATDSRPLSQLPKAAELLQRLQVPFEPQSPEVFEGADLIVLSPGVPADLEPIEAARQRGVDVIGEVELAARYLKGNTIPTPASHPTPTTPTTPPPLL